jgi:hypothetical protein
VFCDSLARPTTAHTGESLLQCQSFGQSIKQIQSVNAAVRVLLGLAIANNAITVLHYRRIIQNLQDKLLQGGHHEILHRDLYAQVLLRLVERLMNCSSQEHPEYIPEPEYIPYSRPRNYVECLGMLLTDMAEGFLIMRQTGMEDEVYISKNMEIHTDHLSSLASRLIGA